MRVAFFDSIGYHSRKNNTFPYYTESMQEFHLQNPELNTKLDSVITAYYHQLSKHETEMTRLVFFRYKRYSGNEYYLYLITVYALIFFKKMSVDDPLLTVEDREFIRLMTLTFQYEMSRNMKQYIKTMFAFNDDLLLVKLIIKYTVLMAEEQYSEFIPHKVEYYEALGWLIPLLSYRKYEIITSFLQDIYFKRLYSEQYNWAKHAHETLTHTTEMIESFMVDITNDMTSMMEKLNIFGIIKLRKKSLFSIYNKIVNKESKKIYDFVGIRIILQDEKDLSIFIQEFEKHFVIRIKKDYITQPKKNGYQWIHYAFIYTHQNFETEIELQLRTRSMNTRINNQDYLTHFQYSCEHNKWNPLFKEVHDGAKMVLECAREYDLWISQIPYTDWHLLYTQTKTVSAPPQEVN